MSYIVGERYLLGWLLSTKHFCTHLSTTDVTLQFTQPEYVGSETNMSVQVAVTIGEQEVQTPLVAEVIPLNLSEVSPPTFDPFRPNRAQS